MNRYLALHELHGFADGHVARNFGDWVSVDLSNGQCSHRMTRHSVDHVLLGNELHPVCFD